MLQTYPFKNKNNTILHTLDANANTSNTLWFSNSSSISCNVYFFFEFLQWRTVSFFRKQAYLIFSFFSQFKICYSTFLSSMFVIAHQFILVKHWHMFHSAQCMSLMCIFLYFLFCTPTWVCCLTCALSHAHSIVSVSLFLRRII